MWVRRLAATSADPLTTPDDAKALADLAGVAGLESRPSLSAGVSRGRRGSAARGEEAAERRSRVERSTRACAISAEVLVGGHDADGERLGEEALPDADRPHEQDVFAAVEKLQRAGGVEDDLREVRVVEPLAPGEGDALGQGVEHPRFRALAGRSTTRDNGTYRASAHGRISPGHGPRDPPARSALIVDRTQPPAAGEAVFPEALFAPTAVPAGDELGCIVPAAALRAGERGDRPRDRGKPQPQHPDAATRSPGAPGRPGLAAAATCRCRPGPRPSPRTSPSAPRRAQAPRPWGWPSPRSPPPTAPSARPTRPAARASGAPPPGSGGSPPAAHNGRPGRSPRRPWPPSRRVPRPRRSGARSGGGRNCGRQLGLRGRVDAEEVAASLGLSMRP